jgi:hypothetical protein
MTQGTDNILLNVQPAQGSDMGGSGVMQPDTGINQPDTGGAGMDQGGSGLGQDQGSDVGSDIGGAGSDVKQ